jgi:hypothetical protein
MRGKMVIINKVFGDLASEQAPDDDMRPIGSMQSWIVVLGHSYHEAAMEQVRWCNNEMEQNTTPTPLGLSTSRLRVESVSVQWRGS